MLKGLTPLNNEAATMCGRKIGYPVMLKASAGGGGIGMQLVHSEEELLKAFEGNQKRAQCFFGDGTMFIEKFIARTASCRSAGLSGYTWECDSTLGTGMFDSTTQSEGRRRSTVTFYQ